MNPRREFLLALFQLLEQKSIPYCVARNYDQLYDDLFSDLDLVVEPKNIPALNACLAQAALAGGYRLVLNTRYVNYSRVYWHPRGGFLRVDLETESRWRVFPVLSAPAILALRRRQGEFYVPHPRHEAVILFVAALWRMQLTERYRKQLSQLARELVSPQELSRTFRSVFGGAGEGLARALSASPMEAVRAEDLRSVKRSLIRHALLSSPERGALLSYLKADLARLLQRLRAPPGISLFWISNEGSPLNIESWLEQLEMLFPAQKTRIHRAKAVEFAQAGVLPCRLRLRRLVALFKGGFFVHHAEARSAHHPAEVARSIPRCLFPSRTILGVEDARGDAILAGRGSGFMAETQTSQSAVGLTAEFVRLISLAAARQKDHRSPPADRNARRTGMVVVLLGLDGSGKTTVARKLCCLGETREQFSAVRYFHWRPNLFGPAPFPFPASGNVPRKAPGRGGLLNDWGSALRLLKNLALTRLAWAWRIRRLLSRTTLVIIDRYYYNYFLDPVSVRYYGPVSWLEKVRPLYPRPDLIVVLKAPAEVLGARKQELSEQEIMRQSTALERVFLDAPHTLAIDATQPASEIARSIFKRIQDLRQGQVPFDPLQGPTLKSAGPPALESNVP